MAIRDVSGLADDQVPDWVRRSRERSRKIANTRRFYLQNERKRAMIKTLTIRKAKTEEHDTLLKIAKTSKYTKDFSNRVMFSSDIMYGKGWIYVAEVDGEAVGFACVRHKVRAPETMLYFITIHPDWRGKGAGEAIIERLMEDSPHTKMALNVMKDNRAVSFYKRLGFKIVAEAMGGEAHRMEKEFT